MSGTVSVNPHGFGVKQDGSEEDILIFVILFSTDKSISGPRLHSTSQSKKFENNRMT